MKTDTAHLLSIAKETAAIGGFHLAAAMVEFTGSLRDRPILLSDARNGHPGQAATPCAKGSMPANGAVLDDNASEALTAGVGKHVPLGGDSCPPVCRSNLERDPKTTSGQAARGAFFSP